jgi:UDP-N-acetylglucosamine:LPS N-acetylglucosamine transferase
VLQLEHENEANDSRTAATAQPLRVCIIGLGGGGFHWQAQRIIRAVQRPLELVLVFAGPGGGLQYWNSNGVIRSQYIVRSPSIIGDGFAARGRAFLGSVWSAVRILRRERPDVVLAAGTAQAIPFAFAARLLGVRLWFVESVTRSLRPSRTAAWLHRFRLTRMYFYWSSLTPELRRGICMEDTAR